MSNEKKIKTFEAPNKKDWELKEFVRARNELNTILKKPTSMFVFCYNCKKQIQSLQVHVVNFGKDACCATCYRKKWSKVKTRVGKFMIPKELDPHFDDQPDTEQYDVQVQEDKIAQQKNVDKSVDIANKSADELKIKMKGAIFQP